MTQRIPKNSDFKIYFRNIAFNVSPTPIDLTTLDDVKCSIAYKNPDNTPVLIKSKLITPDAFTVDNTAKEIVVSILAPEIGSKEGIYFVNLWLISSSNNLTHLVESFELSPSVSYQ